MEDACVRRAGRGVGALVMSYAGIMKFDVACTMIASAVTAKFAVGAAKTFLTKRT